MKSWHPALTSATKYLETGSTRPRTRTKRSTSFFPSMRVEISISFDRSSCTFSRLISVRPESSSTCWYFNLMQLSTVKTFWWSAGTWTVKTPAGRINNFHRYMSLKHFILMYSNENNVWLQLTKLIKLVGLALLTFILRQKCWDYFGTLSPVSNFKTCSQSLWITGAFMAVRRFKWQRLDKIQQSQHKTRMAK